MNKMLTCVLGAVMLLAARAVADEPRPDAKPPVASAGGVYIRTDGTTLFVIRENTEIPIATNEKTDFNIDGKAGAIGDLKPGMQVGAKLVDGVAARVEARSPRKPGDPPREIPKAPNPQGTRIEGQLTAVSPDSITVQSGGDNEVRTTALKVNVGTEVIIDGQKAAASDLKVGQKVNIRASEGIARRIEVPKTPVEGDQPK